MMKVSCWETKNPIVEVMALPELAFGSGSSFISSLETLVVACTSYLDRYATFASERLLLLNFDDITSPSRLYSFKPEHAASIVRFVEGTYERGVEVKRIITACDGGVSRSAAVAAALMLRFGQDDETAIWGNPDYGPNRLVYELLCEALGLKMPKAAIDARVKRNERALKGRIGV